MLLIRTTELSPELASLAQTLSVASGLPVAYLIDERRGVVASTAAKVSITEDKIAQLGLHAPADVGWSCGDYGLYIAQAEHPDAPFFWLIEHDVRISGDVAGFFTTMAARTEDVLTSRLQPADRYWWWIKTAQARDADPFRCFFPMGRFSAAALRLMLVTRQHQSRQTWRRQLWPNDEAFVATTIANSRLSAGDFNATLDQYYDEDSWTYDKVFRTIDVPASGLHAAPKLYHPVLSDENIEKRNRRQRAADTNNNVINKIMRKIYAWLNRGTAWYPTGI